MVLINFYPLDECNYTLFDCVNAIINAEAGKFITDLCAEWVYACSAVSSFLAMRRTVEIERPVYSAILVRATLPSSIIR